MKNVSEVPDMSRFDSTVINGNVSYNYFGIGDSLKELRRHQKLTQYDMAEKLDISYTHYAQLEQGKHKMSIDLLLKLMSVLSVDANTILGFVEEEAINEQAKRKKVVEAINEDASLADFICELSGYDAEARAFLLGVCKTFMNGYNNKVQKAG